MYITNKPEIAKIAENAGTNIIFVDMEYIGKEKRQGGKDTVQNHHTVKDVKTIKNAVSKAKVLARINPIHKANAEYCSTQEEIEKTINAGADILMLPYFKNASEANQFIECVNGRAKTMLLLETSEAAEAVEDIVKIPDIDYIHIGLNDLSLCYGMKFMFELMQNGMVEKLCNVIRKTDIKYGIGGIAAIGGGMLPTEYVVKEHYRLGSSAAILSRSFCNTDKVTNLQEVENKFNTGIAEIRKLEKECMQADEKYFSDNKQELDAKIIAIKQKLG